MNLRGQVVGVNSAIATTGGILGGDSGNIGVGFAIPMEQVRVTAQQILDTGRAEYPVIGANVNTDEGAGGAEVVEVPAGTPADRAGIRVGDRIVAVDGARVADGIALIVAIRSHRPGEVVEMTDRPRRRGEHRPRRARREGGLGSGRVGVVRRQLALGQYRRACAAADGRVPARRRPAAPG